MNHTKIHANNPSLDTHLTLELEFKTAQMHIQPNKQIKKDTGEMVKTSVSKKYILDVLLDRGGHTRLFPIKKTIFLGR
jgi:hypothetical protein